MKVNSLVKTIRACEVVICDQYGACITSIIMDEYDEGVITAYESYGAYELHKDDKVTSITPLDSETLCINV